MKSCIAFFGVVCLLLSLTVAASAQDKKSSTKLTRLDGAVVMIDKNASTIRIRKGNVERTVVYNADTKFTNQNKPGGSLDDVKEQKRVICLGTFNEKTQLVATRIDVRVN